MPANTTKTATEMTEQIGVLMNHPCVVGLPIIFPCSELQGIGVNIEDYRTISDHILARDSPSFCLDALL